MNTNDNKFQNISLPTLIKYITSLIYFLTWEMGVDGDIILTHCTIIDRNLKVACVNYVNNQQRCMYDETDV